MVHSSNFVLCLLINGRVQKDRKNGTVELPFGTEYGLRLRNRHKSRRAVAHIYIDGEKVSGPGYIIDVNDFSDIKRHHDKDRAFKFVDLDSEEAYDAGKDGPNEDKEKGTIEVRFHLEKEDDRPVEVHHHHHHHPKPKPIFPAPWPYPVDPDPYPYPRPTYPRKPGYPYPEVTWTGGTIKSTGSTADSYTQNMLGASQTAGRGMSSRSDGVSMQSASPASTKRSLEATDLEDGCTVEGNLTGQRFTSVYFEEEHDYVACRLFLQGYQTDDSVYVNKHETESVKYCEGCGAKRTKNKGKKAKFCFDCGVKF